MIPESNAKTLHQKIRTRDHSTSKLEPLSTNGSSLKINVIGLPGTFGGAPLGIGTAGVNRADLMSKMDTTHQAKDKKQSSQSRNSMLEELSQDNLGLYQSEIQATR